MHKNYKTVTVFRHLPLVLILCNITKCLQLYQMHTGAERNNFTNVYTTSKSWNFSTTILMKFYQIGDSFHTMEIMFHNL